jgi:hypothetical protein
MLAIHEHDRCSVSDLATSVRVTISGAKAASGLSETMKSREVAFRKAPPDRARYGVLRRSIIASAFQPQQILILSPSSCSKSNTTRSRCSLLVSRLKMSTAARRRLMRDFKVRHPHGAASPKLSHMW